MVVMAKEITLRRIIRRRDLPKYTGLQKSQTDVLISRGEFPKPISLTDGGRARGWLEDEIAAWQAGRIEAGPTATQPPLPRRARAKIAQADQS
jgi:predicted DNA-binding transcriptional regulator AlpA